MVSTPRQCSDVAGKVCNHFLPVKDKEPYTLCSNSRSKSCNADDCCSDCHDWFDEKWDKVSVYHEKLVIHREKKKRKAKYSSSFSGFPLPSVVFIPNVNCSLAHLIMELP